VPGVGITTISARNVLRERLRKRRRHGDVVSARQRQARHVDLAQAVRDVDGGDGRRDAE
jgi:hypothetical protein